MSFPQLGDSGIYIISDTISCDGTGALLSLLKSFKKKVTFFSDPGNFSHYNILLKKFLIPFNYVEFETNLEIGDLPLTENPPVTWQDAPRRLPLKSILSFLKTQNSDVIVFDDIFSIILETSPVETVDLLFAVKNICKILVVKGDSMVISQIWPVEQMSRASIFLSPLASGSSSECLGKIRVEFREKFVKSELGVYYYKIMNDSFVLIDY
jgi:hypothetical protein